MNHFVHSNKKQVIPGIAREQVLPGRSCPAARAPRESLFGGYTWKLSFELHPKYWLRNPRYRQLIFGDLLTLRYLDWTRAAHDVNTALSHNKPLVSVLFDKSTWEQEGHELGSLLKDHGVCLDLSAGSGSALSHQYDQGQVSRLITYCNGTLYGTGDIHPPEPPRTPEHEAQVRLHR